MFLPSNAGKHCQLRVRHTWSDTRPDNPTGDHVAYNGFGLGDARFCTKNMISEGTSRASVPYLAVHTS